MGCKYYITASLLNSWTYNLNNGTLEDFIKVLNKEEFEPTEAIKKGFAFEKYMQENFEETLGGSYQVKLSKECGEYLLYGIVDCIKGGIIYDYKFSGSYEVGKFYKNYQTAMYLELVPEARKMVYLITNKFNEKYPVICSDRLATEDVVQGNVPLEYEIGDLFREEYERDAIIEPIEITVNKFISWLKQMDLYTLFTEKWGCKNEK